MSEVVIIDDERFEEEVLKCQQLAVVDFGAEWCGPCKKLKPILKELAEEYQGRVKFIEVDVDKASQTALKYGIISVPQVLLFKEGKVKETLVGLVPRGKLEERIERYIG